MPRCRCSDVCACAVAGDGCVTVTGTGAPGNPYLINVDDCGSVLEDLEWVNFGDPEFGGQAVPGFDNTSAMQAAVNHAIAIGAAGIKPPLALNHFEIYGRVDMKTVDLHGYGQSRTIFECMTVGAGLDFTAIGSVSAGVYAGHSSGFSVWGGPGPGLGIATRPMVVGRRVSSMFSNIRVVDADQNLAHDGVCMLLSTTQNCLFLDVVMISGRTVLRFDIGAFNNSFVKGEVAGAAYANLEYRATGPSPFGHFPYTGYNTLEDTVIEGTLGSTVYMVRSLAGALNVLRHTPISVNGSIIGGTLPTGMNYAVWCETTESVQSSLIIEDCKMTGGNAAVVAYGTQPGTGARIQLRGGSIGAIDFPGQGNLLLESAPWIFGTVAGGYLNTGNIFVDPRREQVVPTLHKPPSTGAEVRHVQIPGEAQARLIDYGFGNTLLGDGTAVGDILYGRLGTKVWGMAGDACIATGKGATGTRPVITYVGAQYFDTSLGTGGKPIWYHGAGVWRDAMDNVV